MLNQKEILLVQMKDFNFNYKNIMNNVNKEEKNQIRNRLKNEIIKFY